MDDLLAESDDLFSECKHSTPTRARPAPYASPRPSASSSTYYSPAPTRSAPMPGMSRGSGPGVPRSEPRRPGKRSDVDTLLDEIDSLDLGDSDDAPRAGRRSPGLAATPTSGGGYRSPSPGLAATPTSATSGGGGQYRRTPASASTPSPGGSGSALLGGTQCTLSDTPSKFRKEVSAQLRCLKCDQAVLRFEDTAWARGSEYVFFRTHYPSERKLAAQMVRERGAAAYCCQCTWRTESQIVAIEASASWKPARRETPDRRG